MAEIINLNKARKAKARKESEAKAAVNRLAFGRSKAERSRDGMERVRADRRLDGAELPADKTAMPSSASEDHQTDDGA